MPGLLRTRIGNRLIDAVERSRDWASESDVPFTPLERNRVDQNGLRASVKNKKAEPFGPASSLGRCSEVTANYCKSSANQSKEYVRNSPLAVSRVFLLSSCNLGTLLLQSRAVMLSITAHKNSCSLTLPPKFKERLLCSI